MTRLEREILTDSMLKIQSVQASLDQLDEVKLLDRPEIASCLEKREHQFTRGAPQWHCRRETHQTLRDYRGASAFPHEYFKRSREWQRPVAESGFV
jgi:hypothetical protein